uniref:Vesicular, overexpressed in cancer, prosurvival protein 1 n=1 Tax=Caenorhabditis japonica TaxID=281687 RepID=A0A8R1DQ37_CAEJA
MKNCLGLLLLLVVLHQGVVNATVKCPKSVFGTELECAFECCTSFEGPNQGYYCCGLEEKRLTERHGGGHGVEAGRAERFVAYGSTFQVDYTMLVIGLIVSILVSILLSFFCCLLCNGCWLHRRRNPQQYESVHDNGWYPICCGFGIPMGTIVFSSHPPQYREDSEMYGGSSMSSLPSSKQRVRFNPDGTPRGVLKNGHEGGGHGNQQPQQYYRD